MKVALVLAQDGVKRSCAVVVCPSASREHHSKLVLCLTSVRAAGQNRVGVCRCQIDSCMLFDQRIGILRKNSTIAGHVNSFCIIYTQEADRYPEALSTMRRKYCYPFIPRIHASPQSTRRSICHRGVSLPIVQVLHSAIEFHYK